MSADALLFYVVLRSYYSFHEIAVYDFPAMLHLVKNITNSKVTFIGYSAGGTAAFIFASVLKDEAVKYVDLFVTISPALTLGKTFTAVAPILKVTCYFNTVFFTITSSILRKYPL